MHRIVPLVLLLTSPAFATDPSPRTVSLAITLKPAPQPAQLYELQPPVLDLVPGNAATSYLRAGLLRPPVPRESRELRVMPNTVAEWESLTIDQLPLEKLKDYLIPHQDSLEQLDRAARRNSCDWQVESLDRPDQGFAALVPSLDTSRELSNTLRHRCRLELAENRFPAALRSLQTGFQLAKHTGESRTTMEALVAHNVLVRALSSVEDWIGRPNAPNLYWALSTLPQPIIDPRTALARERRGVRSMLGLTEGWNQNVMTDTDATRAVRVAFARWKALRVPGNTDEAKLDQFGESDELATMIAAVGPSAKRTLIANGNAKATIDAMPNAQALLVRTIEQHDRLWDECATMFYPPPHQSWAAWEQLDTRLEQVKNDWRNDPLLAVIVRLQLPLVWQFHRVHIRAHRSVAQLRTLEAIRLHAAKEGRLPDSLETLTSVPVPNDPFTGEPFRYVRRDDGFMLEAVAPKVPDATRLGIVGTKYVVTVRK